MLTYIFLLYMNIYSKKKYDLINYSESVSLVVVGVNLRNKFITLTY